MEGAEYGGNRVCREQSMQGAEHPGSRVCMQGAEYAYREPIMHAGSRVCMQGAEYACREPSMHAGSRACREPSMQGAEYVGSRACREDKLAHRSLHVSYRETKVKNTCTSNNITQNREQNQIQNYRNMKNFN